ncbi:MAG: FkbM family methyltransferase [Aggregatilineales bacterium]
MVWGEYEPESCAAILRHVRPGMCVLDIGAHIGYHTLLLSKQVGHAGQVICFEPLSENRLLLHENLRLNGLAMQVTIEPMAVADRVSLTLLKYGPSTSQASLTSITTSPFEGEVVPVCDLDSYCELLEWLRYISSKWIWKGQSQRLSEV